MKTLRCWVLALTGQNLPVTLAESLGPSSLTAECDGLWSQGSDVGDLARSAAQTTASLYPHPSKSEISLPPQLKWLREHVAGGSRAAIRSQGETGPLNLWSEWAL